MRKRRASPLTDKIIETLRHLPGSAFEVAAVLDASHRTVSARMSQLMYQGELRVIDGSGVAGDPYVYDLVRKQSRPDHRQ